MDNNSVPQYASETMLAFIDILGFKDFLKNKLLPEIVETIENILRADNSSSYYQMLQINTRLISDSFVVYAKVVEPKHLTAYFVYLGTIISRIHSLGTVITRGFVANGDHYSTDRMWISPVFVEAYLKEQKKSFHPRVIIGDSAIKIINRINSEFLDTRFFIRDKDGYRYINYLMCISDPYQPTGDHINVTLNVPTLRDALINHRNTIMQGLTDYPEHFNKYYWLANYHNTHINNNIQLRNKEDLLIDLAKF